MLDGAHHFLVRHRPDAQLQQKTLMPEEVMLKENLLRHFIRITNEKGAA